MLSLYQAHFRQKRLKDQYSQVTMQIEHYWRLAKSADTIDDTRKYALQALTHEDFLKQIKWGLRH